MKRLSSVAVLSLILAVQLAAARTIPTKWVERRPLERGEVVFRVHTIEIRPQSWSVRATIENRSHHFLAVNHAAAEPDWRSCRTGLIRPVFTTDGTSWERSKDQLLAARFVPRMPRVLGPNTKWAGVFSGQGTPRRVHGWRVCFGYFTFGGNPAAEGFSWITDHVFRP